MVVIRASASATRGGTNQPAIRLESDRALEGSGLHSHPAMAPGRNISAHPAKKPPGAAKAHRHHSSDPMNSKRRGLRTEEACPSGVCTICHWTTGRVQWTPAARRLDEASTHPARRNTHHVPYHPRSHIPRGGSDVSQLMESRRSRGISNARMPIWSPRKIVATTKPAPRNLAKGGTRHALRTATIRSCTPS